MSTRKFSSSPDACGANDPQAKRPKPNSHGASGHPPQPTPGVSSAMYADETPTTTPNMVEDVAMESKEEQDEVWTLHTTTVRLRFGSTERTVDVYRPITPPYPSSSSSSSPSSSYAGTAAASAVPPSSSSCSPSRTSPQPSNPVTRTPSSSTATPDHAHATPTYATRRALLFHGKPIIFITARVHPGETPASFVLDGLLDLLLSVDDPRAVALRDSFVFKIIPVLNGDGVALGHYRTDTQGMNLNRVYGTPDPSKYPTVFAVEQLAELYSSSALSDKLALCGSIGDKHETKRKEPGGDSLNWNDQSSQPGRLFAFVDLHAHATRRGCFLFGNAMESERRQVETMLLAKLLTLNAVNFHFSQCSFAAKNMTRVSKRDGMSRAGSSRVSLFHRTGLTRCYTLECNYAAGPHVNTVPPLQGVDRASDIGRLVKAQGISRPNSPYTPLDWYEVGQGLGCSFLDMIDANPCSRLPAAGFANSDAVRRWIFLYREALRERKARVSRDIKASGMRHRKLSTSLATSTKPCDKGKPRKVNRKQQESFFRRLSSSRLYVPRSKRGNTSHGSGTSDRKDRDPATQRSNEQKGADEDTSTTPMNTPVRSTKGKQKSALRSRKKSKLTRYLTRVGRGIQLIDVLQGR